LKFQFSVVFFPRCEK